MLYSHKAATARHSPSSSPERSGAGARRVTVDHDHRPREAQRRLRHLHPGRLRPLQGHDQHRLQLRPHGHHRGQLGDRPRPRPHQHRHQGDQALRRGRRLRAGGPEGAEEHPEGDEGAGAAVEAGGIGQEKSSKHHKGTVKTTFDGRRGI